MESNLTLVEVDDAMKPIVTFIATGSDAELEQQLSLKSQQPNILKFTPKDAKERFGSTEMFKKWQAKGRELHWLLGANNDLAGIIWYGKSEPPEGINYPEFPTVTFAIRIYDGYSGHGLARPFMTQSLKLHVQDKKAKNEEVSAIWLQTDIDNPAAVAAYTKFGYKEVHRDDKRVTMVLDSKEILAITNT